MGPNSTSPAQGLRAVPTARTSYESSGAGVDTLATERFLEAQRMMREAGLVAEFDEDDDLIERGPQPDFAPMIFSSQRHINRPEMDKKLLKKRHLSKQERDMLHNPASDWCETNKGEVCKNACSLEISDLLDKKRQMMSTGGKLRR